MLSQARKVLVYEVIPWAWHFGTALEIADVALDHEAGVVFAHAACDLPYVEGAPYPLTPGDREHFRRALSRGMTLLQSRVHVECGIPEDIVRAAAAEALPPVPTLDALKAWRHRDLDIGMGVASSLISETRNAQYDVVENAAIIQDALRSALTTALHAEWLIQQHRPDLVVLFNGRFGTLRPVLRVAERHGIPVLMHDRGADRTRYFLYTRPPHDMLYLQDEMQTAWNAQPDAARREADARRFYEDARAGVEQSWSSFVTSQVRGTLPADWDRSRRNFVYFGSSDDEFAAIGDGLSSALFFDQFEAIHYLADRIRALPDARLMVRVHPHLAKKHAMERARWEALAQLGVSIVAPDSPISTYTLIENADVVVTFSSTVGVEATFWRRPSISLGPNYYSTLDAAYQPKTRVELDALLRTTPLPVKPIVGSLVYGHFFQTFGIPFKRFRVDALNKGKYLGVDPWRKKTGAREYLKLRRAVLGRSIGKRWRTLQGWLSGKR
jgi:Capsule polysaccharide biosynthesis protein